jgi:hypothetical protein
MIIVVRFEWLESDIILWLCSDERTLGDREKVTVA